jgi:hypothetical protein
VADQARTHTVLRFTFGVTVALVAAELLQWLPTFLVPVLVAVILANVPVRPPPKVAVGLFVVVAASAAIALLLSLAALRTPTILFGLAAVIVFHALYAIARGRPRLAPLMLLICVTTIPVVTLESPEAAGAFAFALVRATVLALVIVWASYLLWPRVMPVRAVATPESLPHTVQLKSALLGTTILTPLMLVYLMLGLADALPVLVATTMIVVNLDFHRGRIQALALVAGNVGGGVIALLMFLLLAVEPSLPSLVVLTALTALAFGWRISARDALAPVFLVALNAALIVFTSSLLTDQDTFDVWMTRLTQFVVAGAFAIGMMALMWPAKSAAGASSHA